VWLEPSVYKRVGLCLAAARKSAGISQDELAHTLRKPQSFISSYECGHRRVDVAELLVILDAIKADPTKVFAAIADMKRPFRRGDQRDRSASK
jgi:transcriptional regulator with XRE-family HTH domain